MQNHVAQRSSYLGQQFLCSQSMSTKDRLLDSDSCSISLMRETERERERERERDADREREMQRERENTCFIKLIKLPNFPSEDKLN